MSARRWLIRGRVQGVGYRRFAQREAAAFSLVGWARNLDDGRVEVMAQGADGALDAMQGRLWEGPRWAEVRDVEVLEASPTARQTSFQIR